MPNHGQGHEIRNGVLPDDPVIFWPRGFGHMRASANNGVLVRISAWYYTDGDGEFVVVPSESINMTPYLPINENNHNTNLIYYDFNTNSYNVVKGTEIIFSALTPPPIPALPHSNAIPVALIRLRYAQTEIDDATDITDVKELINRPQPQQTIEDIEHAINNPEVHMGLEGTEGNILTLDSNGLPQVSDTPIEDVGDNFSVSGTHNKLAKFNSSEDSIEDSRIVDNDTSIEMGSETSLAYGGIAYANGNFSNNGDAQTFLTTVRTNTTNTTPAEMFVDGISQRLVMPTDSTWVFQTYVVASDGTVSGRKVGGYKIEGIIENGSTTTLLGTPVITTFYESDSEMDVSVSADNTNKSLKIEVTGVTGRTLYYVGTIMITQVIVHSG